MDVCSIHEMRNKGNVIVILILLVQRVCTYSYFQREIPNGGAVPHPCKNNKIWRGVGHQNILGTGVRNTFGEDFYAAGNTWSRELCRKDSDGDGKTNGEELGDPNCIWKIGDQPERTFGLTHPGICDPFDSNKCRNINTWVDCDAGEFKCDALHNDEDLLNITLKFPETPVPQKATSYSCLSFDLPTDDEYHMIAFQPIIDNAEVLHHILVYGCSDDAVPLTTPTKCFMTRPDCMSAIAGWAVGAAGECLHKNTGFAIGINGFKRVMMQLHWTNLKVGKENYTDGSGIILHLTKQKRKYNTGVMFLGQEHLKLPPGRQDFEVEGECTSEMSRMRIMKSISVIATANHMHRLGIAMYMEVHRKGRKVAQLSSDPHFVYETLNVHRHEPPMIIQPGDVIKIKCHFNTTSMATTVFQGYGTLDEMCYGLMVFYPKENVLYDKCILWKTIDVARVKLYKHVPIFPPIVNGCNFDKFMNISDQDTRTLHSRVADNCAVLSDCLEECIAVVSEIRNHPCMRGDIGEYLKDMSRNGELADQFKDFYNKIDSCNTEIARKNCENSSNSVSLGVSSCMLILISFFISRYNIM